MPLPSTGSISMSQVNTELQLSSTAQISFNDAAVRGLTGTSSSTALTLPTNFYNQSFSPTSIEFLVVGGGGGGGDGGGGAGGYISGSVGISAGTTYNIGVGGGAGPGGQGGGSSGFGSSVTGGGYGGRGQEGGQGGGSGGGGGYGNGGRGGGGGIGGQGNNGAPGTCFPGQGCWGGGGGGKTQAGFGPNFWPNPPRPGGNGEAWVDGITRGAGGGGSGSQPPGSGQNNAGMGGRDQGSGIGGVVACRYPNNKGNAVATSGSPTFSDTGGFKYYYFNGGGSIRW